MTLFHVIKYPISSPVRLEDLWSIPDEIFNYIYDKHMGDIDIVITREVMVKGLLEYDPDPDNIE